MTMLNDGSIAGQVRDKSSLSSPESRDKTWHFNSPRLAFHPSLLHLRKQHYN